VIVWCRITGDMSVLALHIDACNTIATDAKGSYQSAAASGTMSACSIRVAETMMMMMRFDAVRWSASSLMRVSRMMSGSECGHLIQYLIVQHEQPRSHRRYPVGSS